MRQASSSMSHDISGEGKSWLSTTSCFVSLSKVVLFAAFPYSYSVNHLGYALFSSVALAFNMPC